MDQHVVGVSHAHTDFVFLVTAYDTPMQGIETHGGDASDIKLFLCWQPQCASLCVCASRCKALFVLVSAVTSTQRVETRAVLRAVYDCCEAYVCALATQVTFYLPQLVQCLRDDRDGALQHALISIAQRSDLFAHQVRERLKNKATKCDHGSKTKPLLLCTHETS